MRLGEALVTDQGVWTQASSASVYGFQTKDQSVNEGHSVCQWWLDTQ